MKNKLLGVLGGVGPMATVYFTDMIIRKTDADCDQDHVPMLVYNHSTIPDRTAYILDHSKENPLPVMVEDAKMLERCGCDYIVIPCNTAHYFYDEISNAVGIPVINIIKETVGHILRINPGTKKIGIMATEGTIATDTYKRECDLHGVGCVIPDPDDRAALMKIIYNQVKAGNPVDTIRFMSIIQNLKDRGCDFVILGCTELSVINRDINLKRNDVVDSMEVLAEAAILKCGKKLK